MISVIINTLNEEAHIKGCIKSVQILADEIVVCDMYSTDHTVEFAKTAGARIIYHERTEFVEPARYYAISQASYEWVLVIDADERMTEKLANRLLTVAKEDQVDLVVFSKLVDYFGDFVRYGGFWAPVVSQFFRKASYLETYHPELEEHIHGNFVSLSKFVSRKLVLPKEYYIEHFAYPSIEKFVSKTVGKYARYEAEYQYRTGTSFTPWRLIYEPIKSFFGRFLILRAYKDGIRGFVLCVFYAVYRFAVWANLWFLQYGVNEGISKKSNSDILYKERA